jgi:hypothetical protein
VAGRKHPGGSAGGLVSREENVAGDEAFRAFAESLLHKEIITWEGDEDALSEVINEVLNLQALDDSLGKAVPELAPENRRQIIEALKSSALAYIKEMADTKFQFALIELITEAHFYALPGYYSVCGKETKDVRKHLPSRTELEEKQEILRRMYYEILNTRVIRGGRTKDSGSITEDNKWDALDFVIKKAREIYSNGNNFSKHRVARACGTSWNPYGISARNVSCDAKCSGCQAIDRLIKRCNPAWNWRNDISPRVRVK